ncbi:ABC transporter substrate-binding protein [Streptomyces mayteni]
MPEGKGSGQPDGVFPRTVAHFQGETTLEAEPERVVVISTGQADALLTLGVVPVGSTSGDGAEMIPPYLAAAYPEQADALAETTYVGGRVEPDIETIANLEPDLILMNNAGKEAETLYAALSAVAPTVATQGTGLYWKQDLLLLADALGRTEQAQSWLDDYHADAAAFGETVTDDPTVSFLRRNGDRMRVFGVASFSGSVAEDSGLARPETQRFTDETSVDISSERLDEADGDWIFYGVQGGDESEITSQSLWPTLAAVDAGQTVSVDDDVFYLNVGPTAARGILSELEATLG